MLYDRGFWLPHLICIDARSSNKQTVARKMRALWLGASSAVLFTDLMLQIRLIHLISSNRRRDIKCFFTFDWYQTVTGWRNAASTGTIKPSMWSWTIILTYNIVWDTLQVKSVFVLLIGTSQFPGLGVHMPQYPVFFFQEVKLGFSKLE